MELNAFNAYCDSLAGTTMVRQWGDAYVWKVGGKVFAIASIWGTQTQEFKIGFKVSDLAFQVLTEQDDIEPSPYLGRYKWVQLQSHDALSDDDLKAYISAAHEIIAAKLTKAQRAELGLV